MSMKEYEDYEPIELGIELSQLIAQTRREPGLSISEIARILAREFEKEELTNLVKTIEHFHL